MQSQDSVQDVKTMADWEKLLNQAKPVVVDFYADWCPPCQKLKPFLEQSASSNNGKWILAKVNVDVDDVQELSQKYAAQGIPSVYLFHNKEVKQEFRGFNQKKAQDMVTLAGTL